MMINRILILFSVGVVLIGAALNLNAQDQIGTMKYLETALDGAVAASGDSAGPVLSDADRSVHRFNTAHFLVESASRADQDQEVKPARNDNDLDQYKSELRGTLNNIGKYLLGLGLIVALAGLLVALSSGSDAGWASEAANGGLWAMVAGFIVWALTKRDKTGVDAKPEPKSNI